MSIAVEKLTALLTELRNEMFMVASNNYRTYQMKHTGKSAYFEVITGVGSAGPDSINLLDVLPENLDELLLAGGVKFYVEASNIVSVLKKPRCDVCTGIELTTTRTLAAHEDYDFDVLDAALMAVMAERNADLDTGERPEVSASGIKQILVPGSAKVARQIELDVDGKEYQSYYLHHQSGDMYDTVTFGANAIYGEQIFAMMIDRYEHLNEAMPHESNLETIKHLKAALQAQTDRYNQRKTEGTYGTDTP